MTVDMNIQELKPLKNFGDGPPGNGSMLALKLLLQTLDNIVLVNATGTVTPFIKVNVPFVHAGLNAISVARGIARGLEKGTDKKPGAKVVVFAGDGATAINISAILSAEEDILYVCANDYGYTAIDYHLNKSFAKQIAQTADYTATATVAHPEDYIAKLKRAYAMRGFRFIEVLCPSPESWGYDPSNTMEVGRVAVETGLWPLFEVENSTVNLTKRPNRLEPVENFNHVQKKLKIPQDKIQVIQDAVNRNWKLLTEGRLM